MSENPAGVPAAADNPMAAQQPPAAVASTEGVDVAAIEEALRDVIDPSSALTSSTSACSTGCRSSPTERSLLDMTLDDRSPAR